MDNEKRDKINYWIPVILYWKVRRESGGGILFPPPFQNLGAALDEEFIYANMASNPHKFCHRPKLISITLSDDSRGDFTTAFDLKKK